MSTWGVSWKRATPSLQELAHSNDALPVHERAPAHLRRLADAVCEAQTDAQIDSAERTLRTQPRWCFLNCVEQSATDEQASYPQHLLLNVACRARSAQIVACVLEMAMDAEEKQRRELSQHLDREEAAITPGKDSSIAATKEKRQGEEKAKGELIGVGSGPGEAGADARSVWEQHPPADVDSSSWSRFATTIYAYLAYSPCLDRSTAVDMLRFNPGALRRPDPVSGRWPLVAALRNQSAREDLIALVVHESGVQWRATVDSDLDNAGDDTDQTTADTNSSSAGELKQALHTLLHHNRYLTAGMVQHVLRIVERDDQLNAETIFSAAAPHGAWPLHDAACNPRARHDTLQLLVAQWQDAVHTATVAPTASSASSSSGSTATPVRRVARLPNPVARLQVPSGSFPLHLYASHNNAVSMEGVQCLLQTTTSTTSRDMVSSQDGEGSATALHRLLSNPHGVERSVLQHLVDLAPETLRSADAAGSLPLHTLLRSSMAPAVKETLLDFLLERDPDAVSLPGPHGNTALHLACSRTSPVDSCGSGALPDEDGILLRILRMHRESAAQPNAFGGLPLTLYLEHGRAHIDTVRALVDAFPTALEISDRGRLPLHVAARAGASGAICALLTDVYPEAAGEKGPDSLYPLRTMIGRCRDISAVDVETMIRAAPHVVREQLRNNGTLLHSAVGYNSLPLDAIQCIINANKSAVWTASAEHHRFPVGHIPQCSEERRARIVEMLLAAYPGDDHLQGMDSRKDTDITKDRAATRKLPFPTPDRVALRSGGATSNTISLQGRLRVGVHVVLRGQESAFWFQTGGCRALDARWNGSNNDKNVLLRTLMGCGHVGLLRMHLRRHRLYPTTCTPLGIAKAFLSAVQNAQTEAVSAVLDTWGSAVLQVRGPASDMWATVLGEMWNRDRNTENATSWARLAAALEQQVHSMWSGADAKGATKFLVTAAIRSGNVACLKETLQRLGVDEDAVKPLISSTNQAPGAAKCVLCPAPHVSVDMYRWCAAHKIQCEELCTTTLRHRQGGSQCMRHAIERDDSDVVSFLWPHVADMTRISIVLHATEGGAIQVLRWLHAHTWHLPSTLAAQKATRNGHYKVVRFLREKQNIFFLSLPTLVEAVRASSPQVLETVEYVLRCKAQDLNAAGGKNDSVGSLIRPAVLFAAAGATNVRVDLMAFLMRTAGEETLNAALEQMNKAAHPPTREIWEHWVWAAETCGWDIRSRLPQPQSSRLLAPPTQVAAESPSPFAFKPLKLSAQRKAGKQTGKSMARAEVGGELVATSVVSRTIQDSASNAEPAAEFSFGLQDTGQQRQAHHHTSAVAHGSKVGKAGVHGNPRASASGKGGSAPRPVFAFGGPPAAGTDTASSSSSSFSPSCAASSSVSRIVAPTPKFTFALGASPSPGSADCLADDA